MSNIDELIGLGRPTPEDPSVARTAYRRPQSPDLVGDVVINGALSDDERLWVPQSTWVSFRPLLFGVTHGYYVNLLHVRRAGVLSRHRHSGPVHAWVIKGSWHYLEHDWIASAGTYAFEAPSETHTLVVPDDVEEMITMFHVTGGLVYVDPDGNATGYEDAHTKLALARAHYESVGLGASFADQFVK